MNEYPKISNHEPGRWSQESFARIDFTGRSFAHFIKDDEDEQPRFFAVGRDANNDRTSVSFAGLTNSDIRAFAHEILRQFPEKVQEPERMFVVVIDNDGDEWVRTDATTELYVRATAYATRARASRARTGSWNLHSIASAYGVDSIVSVPEERSVVLDIREALADKPEYRYYKAGTLIYRYKDGCEDPEGIVTTDLRDRWEYCGGPRETTALDPEHYTKIEFSDLPPHAQVS